MYIRGTAVVRDLERYLEEAIADIRLAACEKAAKDAKAYVDNIEEIVNQAADIVAKHKNDVVRKKPGQ